MKRSVDTRLRYGWQFRRLFRVGFVFRGAVLKARYSRNTLGVVRLGFAVSAKKGNAPQRNLFKRRLRQYARQKAVSVGFDAVLIPIVPLADISWTALLVDMDELVSHMERKFL